MAAMGLLGACSQTGVEGAPAGPDAAPSWDQIDRERMVEHVAGYSPALRVRDPKVLAAMRKVPRHEFVPLEFARLAYSDQPLPIGEDQTISQPFIVGYMTEALALKPGDRVLEIGTGSGYQAAILAELAGRVYTIEIVESLGKRAERTLARLGYKNVEVKIGDGYRGWPEKAPFDAIIVTCAPDHVPEALARQLRPGGLMMIPVGEELGGRPWAAQELILVRKTGQGLVHEKKMDVRFVPMTGEAQEAAAPPANAFSEGGRDGGPAGQGAVPAANTSRP